MKEYRRISEVLKDVLAQETIDLVSLGFKNESRYEKDIQIEFDDDLEMPCKRLLKYPQYRMKHKEDGLSWDLDILADHSFIDAPLKREELMFGFMLEVTTDKILNFHEIMEKNDSGKIKDEYLKKIGFIELKQGYHVNCGTLPLNEDAIPLVEKVEELLEI